MQLSNVNKMKFLQIYQKYQKEYNLTLPKISDIRISCDESSWAKFISEDLYNKRYILYINKEFSFNNNYFIKQILYHEFTHLADSLNYLSETKENFDNIMASYSEFHASKIEMIERLHQVNEAITDDTLIMLSDKITIKSFMQQSFGFLLDDFKKMEYSTPDKPYFELCHLYYYLGYISALHDFNMSYNFDWFTLPVTFMTKSKETADILLNNNTIDVYKVKQSYCDIIENVQANCQFNVSMNKLTSSNTSHEN